MPLLSEQKKRKIPPTLHSLIDSIHSASHSHNTTISLSSSPFQCMASVLILLRTILPGSSIGSCIFFSTMHSWFILLAKVQLNPQKQSSLGSVVVMGYFQSVAMRLEHRDSLLMEKGLMRLGYLVWLDTFLSVCTSRVRWYCRNSFWKGERSERDCRRRTFCRGKKSAGRRFRFSLIDFCREGWGFLVFWRRRNSKGSASSVMEELPFI